MTIWWILAGVIIIIMFLIGRKFKNATLDKLALLSGEKILFETEAGKVVSQTGPRPMMFPRCFVRVTNKRIIVAQHTLFEKKNAVLPLRYVINYAATAEDPNKSGYGGGALKTGYITLTTTVEQIQAVTEKNKTYVEIKPQSPPGWTTGVPYYVRIFTERAEDCLSVLK